VTERLWRPTFVLVEVVLLLAIPVLAYRGFDAVLGTTEGQAVDPELDPQDPGYEAFLEPTPLLLVLGLDDEGALSWSSLLVLGGDAGGSVIAVPASLLVPPLPPFNVPEQTLAARYEQLGRDSAVQGVFLALGIGIEAAVEVGPERVAELVRPVAPITVQNPDRLDDFDRGELSLEADDVASYLLAADDGESELARIARQEEVWSAWLGAVAASDDPDVVPGEREVGLGRFVRGLAGGPHTFETLPMSEEPDPVDPTGTALRVDPTGVVDFLEEVVPFPVGTSPGERLRVRVLDGVGADGLQRAVARDVVRAGGQVVLVGNSDEFGADETRLVYFDGALTERAEAMGAELGIPVEQIEGLNPDDRVDVTVVAGRDRLATYGLTTRSTDDGGGTPG
jgi:hypothetical protein